MFLKVCSNIMWLDQATKVVSVESPSQYHLRRSASNRSIGLRRIRASQHLGDHEKEARKGKREKRKEQRNARKPNPTPIPNAIPSTSPPIVPSAQHAQVKKWKRSREAIKYKIWWQRKRTAASRYFDLICKENLMQGKNLTIVLDFLDTME